MASAPIARGKHHINNAHQSLMWAEPLVRRAEREVAPPGFHVWKEVWRVVDCIHDRVVDTSSLVRISA